MNRSVEIRPDRNGDYVLETALWLPKPRDEVFAFFSDAANLEALTPDAVRFRITTPLPVVMKEGALIDYRLRVHGMPIRWQTKITRWRPPHEFMDIQLKGPYRKWEHLHSFEDRDGGTLCSDRVVYRPPGGWLVNRIIVQSDVVKIFKYRTERMLELFGSNG